MDERRAAIAYDCLFPLSKGGGERQYRAFAAELSRRGFRVDYLTARQWGDTLPHFRDLTPIAVSPPLDLYAPSGVRRTRAALRFAAGLFAALLRRRRQYSFVVISGLPLFNVFAARLALLGSRTRVVIDYLEVWGRRQWVGYAGPVIGNFAWAVQRAAVSWTPIATCHSALSASRLRAEGFRGRLLLSPGLIDGHGATDGETRPPSDPPYALYVGRHIADKQVECIPAAVKHARRAIPELELVIAGDGPSTTEVRSAIEDADGAGWTQMPGFVSESRLAELIGSSSCLVNPSRREGYGLVVVEAARHGVPVVLVAGPGNASTELVETGENGFVAASASPADLGDAIVSAVRGGSALRASTHAWYEHSRATRTISETIAQLLRALEQPAEPPTDDLGETSGGTL